MSDDLRVCRKCSTHATADADFCPRCGTSFERRRWRPGKRGLIVLGAALAVLLTAGATTVVLVKHHNDQIAREHRIAAQRAAHQRALAAIRQQAQQAEQQALHDEEIAIRRETVKALQDSVTKDARKDVADGTLNGPILRTECTPVGGGNTDDVAQHTGDFSCLAVSTVNGDGTESGYSFSATVNYDTGSYTWHLGNGQ